MKREEDKKTRIQYVFKRLRDEGGKALITFITAGDPDLSITKELIFTLERSGADIIELGIPFSDPMADGPTIQASSERALKKGVTLFRVLTLVKEVREKSEVPLILFGYYNPIFHYGPGRFAAAAKRAGVDGVLIVDLPPEESGELKKELDRAGIDLVFLLTPTSDAERMRLVASKGSGFIYFVSLTGVTGARKKLSTEISGHLKEARKFTDLPIGVGFGVSSPAQAKKVCGYADGVIVGSAIIDIISRGGGRKKILREVGRFVSGMKKGMS
ncbi:MAG: tryptophan synthase subunit alpha [Thermodesulfobacteriota bacterium]